MNIRLFALAITLLASNVALTQETTTPPPSQTEHAQGRGCVHPGNKKGCFVLHDIRQHRYWDLTFTGDNRPDLYTHIWFEGIGYPHDAHCAQGRPVHVTTWKIVSGECSKPTAPESNTPPQSHPQ